MQDSFTHHTGCVCWSQQCLNSSPQKLRHGANSNTHGQQASTPRETVAVLTGQEPSHVQGQHMQAGMPWCITEAAATVYLPAICAAMRSAASCTVLIFSAPSSSNTHKQVPQDIVRRWLACCLHNSCCMAASDHIHAQCAHGCGQLQNAALNSTKACRPMLAAQSCAPGDPCRVRLENAAIHVTTRAVSARQARDK